VLAFAAGTCVLILYTRTGSLSKKAAGLRGGKIFLVHSKDDPVVPFEEMEIYSEKLPEAERVVFENNGHFNQEHFPELVEMIRGL